jgi:hypothetical protein
LEEGQQTVQPFLTILKGKKHLGKQQQQQQQKAFSEFLKFEICETEIRAKTN